MKKLKLAPKSICLYLASLALACLGGYLLTFRQESSLATLFAIVNLVTSGVIYSWSFLAKKRERLDKEIASYNEYINEKLSLATVAPNHSIKAVLDHVLDTCTGGPSVIIELAFNSEKAKEAVLEKLDQEWLTGFVSDACESKGIKVPADFQFPLEENVFECDSQYSEYAHKNYGIKNIRVCKQ